MAATATVGSIASTINANAALQAPGAMAGGNPSPAPQNTAVTGTNTAPQVSPNSGLDINSLTAQFQQALATSNGAVSSESQDIQTQMQNAIQNITGSTNTANTAIANYYGNQSTMMQQQQGVAMNNQANNMGTGGLAKGSLSLQMINDDNAQALETLNSQMSAAIASNNNQLQQSIGQLVAQQLQMTLTAKQDVVQNMISGAGTEAQLSQAATAQASQQETTQNDMANLASQFGVTIQPGWTLTDVVGAIAPKASAKFALSLGEAQSQITENNANAALAQAQASLITPQTPANMGVLFTAINMAPPGGPLQQMLNGNLADLIKANPNNAITYSQISNEATDRNWNLTPTASQQITPDMMNLMAMITSAQANNMSFNDAVTNYITNNQYMSSATKAQAFQMFEAGYGTTWAANPWSTAFSTASENLSFISSAPESIAPGKLGPSAQFTAELGAYSYSRGNPGSNNVPGGNPGVNAITGNHTTSYNQWLQTTGAGTYQGVNLANGGQ